MYKCSVALVGGFVIVLSVLGLRCCAGLSLVEVHGLLILVAFLSAEHSLQSSGLSSFNSQVLEPHRLNSCGTWT